MSFNIRRVTNTGLIICTVCALSLIFIGGKAYAAEQVIYADGLQNGWQNWSWAKSNLDNKKPVHSGQKSISITVTKPYSAAFFHHTPVSTNGYKAVDAWVYNGSKVPILIAVTALMNKPVKSNLPWQNIPPKKWVHIVASLKSLNIAGKNIEGIWFQEMTNKPGHVFYLDDVKLK